MIVLEIEGDDGTAQADNPDNHTDKNSSGVCNDFSPNSRKMLNMMNDGHVLVNGDDENVKNH